jgi:putative tricarboxylic transport membrane protein
MKFNDAIAGALFVAIAICVFVYAGTFPAMRGVAYGPDLFPRIIAVMMGVGGATLIVGGLRPAGRQPWLQLADWARQPKSYGLFAAVVGSMVFYILASDRLGFLLSSFLMMSGLLLVTRGPARLVSSLVVAAVVSAAIYLIFVRMLRVPMPYGFVESLLVR